MDFRSLDNCEKYFEEHKNDFDYVIHSGGLSSPMIRHKKYPTLSIQTNIIGTSNIAIVCEKYKKKLIYISTNYVYPGIKGNHTEESELKPFTHYGWSKLGGECAVMHYDNTLILRACMNAVPFPHEKAFTDVISSHMYANEAAEVTLKLLDEVGVINVGGPAQTVYDFVVEHEPNVGKISVKEITNLEINTNSSMNNDKMKQLLNDTTF
jgi:dTDP-4-dehydrorhamnose reductase